MAQYKTGTATVTNNSTTVTGSGTLWASNVNPGDGFTVAGTGVPYTVASVTNDTSLELSAPYQGATASGQSYAIYRDFTTNESLPELSQGDIETATIWTRALRKIDGLLGAATTTSKGTVEKATTAEAQAGTADKFPDASGVHAAFNQYGLGQRTFNVNNFSVGTKNSFVVSEVDAPSSGYHYGFILSGSGTFSASIAMRNAVFWRSSRFEGWRRLYDQQNILGTVSQSSGVPTGAIIERGSSANGEYVKFADGTLICHRTIDAGLSTEFGTGVLADMYRTGTSNWTFPVSFFEDPVVTLTASCPEATTGSNRWASTSFQELSPSQVSAIQVFRGSDDAHNVLVHVKATGRWY